MVAVALMATSALYFRVVYIGLEFGLLLLLVCFFWALFSTAPDSSQPSTRAPIVAGGCAGALAGTRPESVVLAPLVCAVMLAVGRGRGRIRSVAYLCAAWAVIRRSGLHGASSPTANGCRTASSRRRSIRTPFVTLAGAAARRGIRDRRLHAEPGNRDDARGGDGRDRFGARSTAGIDGLLCAPLVVGHAAVVQNGGDWMPYFRFVAVLTPIYIAGFCVATAEWLGRRSRAAAASVVVVAAVHLASNARVAELSFAPRIGSFDGWMDLYRQAGARCAACGSATTSSSPNPSA